MKAKERAYDLGDQLTDDFAEVIEAAENDVWEACARIADAEHENPGDDIDAVLTRIAEAFRKRGKQ